MWAQRDVFGAERSGVHFRPGNAALDPSLVRLPPLWSVLLYQTRLESAFVIHEGRRLWARYSLDYHAPLATTPRGVTPIFMLFWRPTGAAFFSPGAVSQRTPPPTRAAAPTAKTTVAAVP